MSQLESIKRIDKFIKQLDDRDLIPISEKMNKRYGFESKGYFKTNFESVGTLGEMLSKYLALYQQGKTTTDSSLRTMLIDEALRWINIVITDGAVKAGDDIYRKYEEAQDENTRLKKELESKQDELQETSAELLECEAERRSLKHQLAEMIEKFGQPN